MWRGREEEARFFAVLAGTLEFERFGPREFVARGDRVVAPGGSRDRKRSAGRVVETEWAAVFTVRGGNVASRHIYEDTATFVEALRIDSRRAVPAKLGRVPGNQAPHDAA